eukprot:jgi/Psemu1/33726/gm1.33726_g
MLGLGHCQQILGPLSGSFLLTKLALKYFTISWSSFPIFGGPMLVGFQHFPDWYLPQCLHFFYADQELAGPFFFGFGEITCLTLYNHVNWMNICINLLEISLGIHNFGLFRTSVFPKPPAPPIPVDLIDDSFETSPKTTRYPQPVHPFQVDDQNL